MSFQKLINNYHDYAQSLSESDKTLYESLSNAQNPDVMLITCCDSRMQIGKLFSSDIGDLFVTRNVANIVPPYEPDERHHGTSAAIEFATKDLKVKDIIVLGHSNCGGIKAVLADHKQDEFIGKWLELIKHDIDPSNKTSYCQEHVDEVAKENILLSIERLKSYPWIGRAVQKESICLHGWFFNIASAQIYCHVNGTWEKL